MDKETQELIKERFSALTPDVKKAVSAADLPTRIENIATKNDLHIDQSGGLLTEVYLVMLGIEKSDSFAGNVSKNLGISLNLATAVAGDVNREIFLPIRQSLIDMSRAKDELEKNANSIEEVPNPERDQLLHDIENPQPTPERGSVPITDPAREIASRSATNDFIASKLAAPSVSTAEKVTMKPPQSPEAPSAQKKYSADPYREPLQ